MNNIKFGNLVNKLANIMMNTFLILSLLSSLYVCTYVVNNSIRAYVYIGLIVLFLVIFLIFKNKIYNILNKIYLSINKVNEKKLLFIIILVLIVLEVVYSLFYYYDPTLSNDVISIYVDLAKRFVYNGVLNKTIGDSLVSLTVHLSLFEVLNIPYNIGIFIVICLTVLINYLSFKQIIGKERSFIASLLYCLMPSTCLLSFCPIIEVFELLYLSVYFFILIKLLNTAAIFKKIIYSLLLIIDIFVLRSFGYIGYVLMVITFIQIIVSNINKYNKHILTAVLIISILINNIFYYGISYQWRNNEYLYKSLLSGSNINTNGRFEEDYVENLVEEYIVSNNMDSSHESQTDAYIDLIISNYSYLISNPDKLVELFVNKYYVNWSGSHYSIEMLKNETNLTDNIFYLLLGINVAIYIIVIMIGILSNDNRHNIYVNTIELIVIFVSIVLLIGELQNKHSLVAIPYIYFVCFSKMKD